MTYEELKARLRMLGVLLVKTVNGSPSIHLWFNPSTGSAVTVQDLRSKPLSERSLNHICARLGFSRAELDSVL